MKNKTTGLTVKKCGFPDGEAVAVRAYDFEDWCLGILGSLRNGTRTIKVAGESVAGTLDPRNQIRKQTFKTYTQVVYIREDGAQHAEPLTEITGAK